MKFEWERIFDEGSTHQSVVVQRAKTFGGWIVKDTWHTNFHNDCMAESMIFVPDPNHEWSIEE